MDFDMQKNLTLPVLPLRGLVVFPKSLIHFDVGRKKSITAINKAKAAQPEKAGSRVCTVGIRKGKVL